jgi:AraC-like DNA-binding protein
MTTAAISLIPDPSRLDILRHATGRFDRRFGVGPAMWPFHDLLWIHSGRVRLSVAGTDHDLRAPDGIWLPPGTSFHGRATSGHAEASICHFSLRGEDGGREVSRPAEAEAVALQAMVVLSLRLSEADAPLHRRQRLLAAILDGFSGAQVKDAPESRVDRAWRLAEARLDRIRTLADVAAQAGLSESTFRALHRAERGGPAGAHLQDLRLRTAERLLATSGLTLAEIARSVGYGHAETLSIAFRASRGRPPGAFRRTARPFA